MLNGIHAVNEEDDEYNLDDELSQELNTVLNDIDEESSAQVLYLN